MGLTEDVRGYAKVLEIDLISFCSVESFDRAPEDRRPSVYLEGTLQGTRATPSLELASYPAAIYEYDLSGNVV